MRPKQLPQFIIVLTLVLFVVGGVFAVSTQVEALDLQLKYPYIPFTDPTGAERGLEELVKDPNFLTIPNIIIWLFQTAIWIGALAALFMLIFVGFQFATSGGNPMKRTVAKDRLKGVALGVVILTSSFFLLNTINPELTSLRFLQKGVCSEPGADCDKELGFDFSVENAAKTSGGLVLYEKKAFDGNSHTIINNIKDARAALAGKPSRGTRNGALKYGWSGGDIEFYSLKLSPGCAVKLYDLETPKYLLVTNYVYIDPDTGIETREGRAVVYVSEGVRMTPDPPGDTEKEIEERLLWFDRVIPLEASSNVLLLSYIADFKNETDGSNEWTDDVGAIEFVSSATIDGITRQYPCSERRGLVLYEDVDSGGRQQVFLEDNVNIKSEFIDQDSASSLKIIGNMKVTVYEHDTFTGKAMEIENRGGNMMYKNFDSDNPASGSENGSFGAPPVEISDLGAVSMFGGGNWNEVINSLKIDLDVEPSSLLEPEILTFGVLVFVNGFWDILDTVSLSNPDHSSDGESITLTWSTQNAVTCAGLEDDLASTIESVGNPANGSATFTVPNPLEITHWNIVCKNSAGQEVTKPLTVNPGLIMGPAPPPSGGSGGFDVDFWLFFRTDGGEFRGGGQFLPTSLSAITDSAGDMRFGWEATNTNAECRLHNVGSGGGILENDLPSGGESIIRNIQVPVGSDKLILKIACSVGGEEERSQSIYVLR